MEGFAGNHFFLLRLLITIEGAVTAGMKPKTRGTSEKLEKKI